METLHVEALRVKVMKTLYCMHITAGETLKRSLCWQLKLCIYLC